jgi:putative FmdB family regulatory protein
MPIYDFKCRECGEVSEVLVRNVESPDIRCPACGGSNMEKLISSSFLIKASQLYTTGTCCGRTERCGSPPCSTDEGCRRH